MFIPRICKSMFVSAAFKLLIAFFKICRPYLLPATSSVARQICPAEFYVDRMLAITSGTLLAAAVSGATRRWIHTVDGKNPAPPGMYKAL